MPDSVPASPEPWRIDGFVEVGDLGAGAQGRVVLARHGTAGTPVAIKYIEPGDGDVRGLARLRDEAVMLGRVHDPHVVRLYRFVEDVRGAALVMEVVDGVSLKRILAEHGALRPEAALTVLKGSLLGLAAAHAVGVVHRDYKPANVVVRPDGLSKLIDFGVATLAGERTGSGSPAYMAPEQWERRPASPATDVYAATCVFFECITGRRPFGGTDAVGLAGLHLRAPVPLDDVPAGLRDLVARGMAKSPDDRPFSAALFAAELEEAAAAAFGADWEGRGVRALAGAAVALAALFPLVAAGLTPAVGGAGGGAAGSGGLLGLGGAKAAAASAAAAAAIAVGSAGVYVARSDDGGAAARPAVVRSTPGLSVRKVTAIRDPVGPISRAAVEYPQVSGLPAGLRGKVNTLIDDPVQQWLKYAYRDLPARPDPEDPPDPRSTFTYQLGLTGPKLLSVRYGIRGNFALKNNRFYEIVIVDLETGRALEEEDLFRPDVMTRAGMSAFTQLLYDRVGGGLCGGRYWDSERQMYVDIPPEAEDLTPAQVRRGRMPMMPVKTGIDFYPPMTSMGYGMACQWTMIDIPYARLGMFIRPEILQAAGTPVPSPTP